MSERLSLVLDFGDLYFSGLFPKPNERIPNGRVAVLLCEECKSAQLSESFDANLMFSSSYGYKSRLNSEMISHLEQISISSQSYKKNEINLIVDIASNDGTLLNSFAKNTNAELIGIDPISKFLVDNYNPKVKIIPHFFTDEVAQQLTNKADIVTSLAVFYDVEDPLRFATNVKNILKKDGIWILEVSYTPFVIKSLAFDTICHEHQMYFTMTNLKNIFEKTGLKIVDFSLNKINGGSLNIITTNKENDSLVEADTTEILKQEEKDKVLDKQAWIDFGERVDGRTKKLRELLQFYKAKGMKVVALGASTKGNILLQVAKIDKRIIEVVGEVNPDKYGCITPGTSIPIDSEENVLKGNPDVILVLPWHFKASICERIKKSSYRGIVVFPFPELEIIKFT